jgi:hypothetical protein
MRVLVSLPYMEVQSLYGLPITTLQLCHLPQITNIFLQILQNLELAYRAMSLSRLEVFVVFLRAN